MRHRVMDCLYDGRLDSTPELNPITQTKKGGMSMKYRPKPFLNLMRQVLAALGSHLGRIHLTGIGITPVPGITYNISLRAGESGRAYHQFYVL